MNNIEPQFYEFFDSIPIPDSLKDKIIDENGQIVYSIKETRKINIIVGENDAGKSYLMRELFKYPQEPNYESASLGLKIKKVVEESYKELLQVIGDVGEQILKNEWKIVPSTFNENDTNGLCIIRKGMFHFLEDEIFLTKLLVLYCTLTSNKDLLQNNSDFIYRFECISTGSATEAREEISNPMIEVDKGRLVKWIEKWYLNIYPFIFNKKGNSVEISEKHLPLIQNTYNHYFVHHLRTLRKDQLKDLNSIVGEVAFSQQSLWNEHNVSLKSVSLKDNNSINDFVQYGYVETGITLHADFDRMYYNVPGRKVLSKFEEFISDLIFDGEEVAIVPARSIQSERDKSLSEFQIQIGDQKPRPINELGTGIQMIIILTWFMFESEYGVVFIEEPELFIHPGLQRQLMKIYAKHPRSNKFKFFIATHSNHITDFIQYEPELCSMYLIKKVLGDNPTDPKFMLKHYTEDEVLQTLGVTQSSLFLANCAIWVEGITDWKYIRVWFELYLKTKKGNEQFKEGLHYTFVEYGGALLKHWAFHNSDDSSNTISAPRVTRNVLVIADRGANENRTNELTQRINQENLFITQGDEIENLIEDEILREVVKNLEGKKSLGKAVKIRDKDEYISKKLVAKVGWLIDTYFQYDDGTPLSKKYSDESGTVKSKRKFSETVVNETIKKFNNGSSQSPLTIENLKCFLSNETIELCDKMFEFIKRHNT